MRKNFAEKANAAEGAWRAEAQQINAQQQDLQQQLNALLLSQADCTNAIDTAAATWHAEAQQISAQQQNLQQQLNALNLSQIEHNNGLNALEVAWRAEAQQISAQQQNLQQRVNALNLSQIEHNNGLNALEVAWRAEAQQISAQQQNLQQQLNALNLSQTEQNNGLNAIEVAWRAEAQQISVQQQDLQQQLNALNLSQSAQNNGLNAIEVARRAEAQQTSAQQQNLQEQLNALNRSQIEQNNSLNALQDAQRAALDATKTQLLETMINSRGSAAFDFERIALTAPAPWAKRPSVHEQERMLQSMVPDESWQEYVKARDTGTESYAELPEGSCSTERHPQARLFRAFLRTYLRGCVLDIGCGPQAVPFYLTGYPLRAICGLDPISSQEDHPFTFVSGYGEILPWDDSSFDVVILATTLDHYLLLDRGLTEARRVLKPGGHLVAWITHFEGAPTYDPYAPGLKAFDSEHLYHISLDWFIPMIKKIGFIETEVIEFPLPFRYLFMSFEKV